MRCELATSWWVGLLRVGYFGLFGMICVLWFVWVCCIVYCVSLWCDCCIRLVYLVVYVIMVYYVVWQLLACCCGWYVVVSYYFIVVILFWFGFWVGYYLVWF